MTDITDTTGRLSGVSRVSHFGLQQADSTACSTTVAVLAYVQATDCAAEVQSSKTSRSKIVVGSLIMSRSSSSASLRTAAWRRLRREWKLRIESAGGWVCWRCGGVISPREPFDLGHIVDRAAGGSVSNGGVSPEHRACNRSAGAELGQQLREQQSWPCIVSPPGDEDALFGVPAPAGSRLPTSIKINKAS